MKITAFFGISNNDHDDNANNNSGDNNANNNINDKQRNKNINDNNNNNNGWGNDDLPSLPSSIIRLITISICFRFLVNLVMWHVAIRHFDYES